jgi:signal transduction histidine kinase
MDNLLCNAATYTKEGGKIRIYTKQGRAGKKEFIIENTPCEPVDVTPEKLWEPFIKGDPSRSEKKGSGLGLSITKNILDNFGYKSEIKINKDCFSVIIK